MTPFGLGPLAPNFDAALRDVQARDPKFREAAALVLGWPPEDRIDEAREALRQLLDDELGPIRALGAAGLGEIGDIHDGPMLLAFAEDAHASVRASAIRSAARVVERTTYRAIEDAILVALDDASSVVRSAAIECLELLESSELFGALKDALEDVEDTVRTFAIVILERIAPREDVRPLLKEAARANPVLDSTRNAALALTKHGWTTANAESTLTMALQDPLWRLGAIEGLRHLKSEESADALASLGSRRFVDLVSRAAAGEALAKRNDTRAEAILRAVMKAFRADGRDYALRAIAAHRLTGLQDDVNALSKRRRGASQSAIDEALKALA